MFFSVQNRLIWEASADVWIIWKFLSGVCVNPPTTLLKLQSLLSLTTIQEFLTTKYGKRTSKIKEISFVNTAQERDLRFTYILRNFRRFYRSYIYSISSKNTWSSCQSQTVKLLWELFLKFPYKPLLVYITFICFVIRFHFYVISHDGNLGVFVKNMSKNKTKFYSI